MNKGRDTKQLVTALIVNFNYARFLDEAINSVLQQTYSPIEILVVDDGSTDDSLEVLGRYGRSIRVICRENGGQAAALNTGIRAARGSIICFLDADDIWSPTKVAKVVEAFSDRQVSLVCHEMVTKFDKSRPTYQEHRKGIEPVLLEGDLKARLVEEGFPWVFSPTSGLSVPTTVARAILPIPEEDWKICADNPLAYGAAFQGSVRVIRESLASHRCHDANAYFGAVSPSDRRKMIVDFPKKRLDFLNQMLPRLGQEITETLEDHYIYQKNCCFYALPIPILGLASLWRANTRRIGAGKTTIPSCLYSLVEDMFFALVLSVGIPNRQSQMRRRFWD